VYYAIYSTFIRRDYLSY